MLPINSFLFRRNICHRRQKNTVTSFSSHAADTRTIDTRKGCENYAKYAIKVQQKRQTNDNYCWPSISTLAVNPAERIPVT